MLHFPEEQNPFCDGYGNGEYIVHSLYIFKFNVHGTVHRSMTNSNNQRDAA